MPALCICAPKKYPLPVYMGFTGITAEQKGKQQKARNVPGIKFTHKISALPIK